MQKHVNSDQTVLATKQRKSQKTTDFATKNTVKCDCTPYVVHKISPYSDFVDISHVENFSTLKFVMLRNPQHDHLTCREFSPHDRVFPQAPCL